VTRKPPTFSDQIRAAIDASGVSRYRICKTACLSEATMSRFMSGKGGLSMEMLDRIGKMLGLRVVADAMQVEVGKQTKGKQWRA